MCSLWAPKQPQATHKHPGCSHNFCVHVQACRNVHAHTHTHPKRGRDGFRNIIAVLMITRVKELDPGLNWLLALSLQVKLTGNDSTSSSMNVHIL